MAVHDANSRTASLAIAILVPKADEFSVLCCAFGLDSSAHSDGKTSGGHFYWETTADGMQVVIVLLSAQGNSLARGVTEQVLAQFRPRLLFLVGTAAGRIDEAHVYDVVASQKVFDCTEWKFQPGNVAPRINCAFRPS